MKCLENVYYIIVEVNRGELYEGCPMVEEIDDFLCAFGFSRVDQAFSDRRADQEYTIAAGSTAADFDDSIFTPTTLQNFMNGFNGFNNTDANYYFDINHDAAYQAFTGALGANMTAGQTDSNSRVTEVLDSVYIQLNFESTFKDRPLNT